MVAAEKYGSACMVAAEKFHADSGHQDILEPSQTI